MTINCKGFLIDLSTPIVMGILNLTPDSFYDGGKHSSKNKILDQVAKFINEGASIIDLGGYSSRPGAKEITVKEEINRTIPVVKEIIKNFPNVILSIDTFRKAVAEKAVNEGVSIVNDISAGNLDPEMLKWVGQEKIPYILMHMQGNPSNMQKNPTYKDVVEDLNFFFSKKINKLLKMGVNDIIVDVGFGFGKTTEHNFELLKNMRLLETKGFPILAGISRKSMIYKTLRVTAEEALNGSTALNMIALQQGAKILRVHDVKEAVECIKLFGKIST